MVTMERNGVELDANALGKQQLDVIAQMETIKAQAFELAGNAFNLESPKQIQQIACLKRLHLILRHCAPWLPKQQSGVILAFDKACKVWHNSPILVPKLR
jgi:hypothetical protein